MSTDEAVLQICTEKGETSEECLKAKADAEKAKALEDAKKKKPGGSG